MFRFCMAAYVAVILIGCSGNGNGDVSPTQVQQPAAGQLSLPAPVGLAERVGSALTSSRVGSDYDAVLLPEQNVLPAGEKGLYEPTWLSASKSSFDDLAYALYTFELPEYQQARYLNSSWSFPPASGSYFVALGNMVTDSWNWFNATPGEQLIVPEMENYMNANDVLLAVVVVAETGDFMLDQLWFEGELPGIVQVTPMQGDPGNPVTFNAEVNGEPGFTYAWDFGEATIPSQSTDESPNVIFGTVGKFDASLTVTNGLGVDTFDFSLHVGVPIIVDVSPTWGISGQDYLFGATVFSTQPESYAWNFGGGGIPDNSDLPSPLITFGDSGEYSCTLTVLNTYGADNLDFTLTVKEPPVAALEATPTSGDAPLEVSMDAGGSYDPDGSIVLFEWDWEGDGNYDDATGTNPLTSHVYSTVGEYLPTVRATDDDGGTGTASITIAAHGWDTPRTPDSMGAVGTFTSLAVVDGNPAISYFDANNNDLKYVRATNADGSSWGAPQTPDTNDTVGHYTSLAIVASNPAISYYDATNMGLKYVRATNADGSSWGTPKTLDSSGNVGYYTSLAIVAGNPAISYFDGTNLGLKYVRATNADGSSWGTPQTLDSSGNVGYYTSLAVVDGCPAISYQDSTNGDLKYVRATNTEGTSWGALQTIDSNDSVGYFTSLAVVDGNPAISYFDGTNLGLKYIRATNADGSSWGTPKTLDSTGDVGRYTSLCVVDGNPAISYYDNSNGNLKYVQATNADGSSWGTPQILDSSGNVGRDTSLCVVDGNPAISYWNVTNYDLKYVRWY